MNVFKLFKIRSNSQSFAVLGKYKDKQVQNRYTLNESFNTGILFPWLHTLLLNMHHSKTTCNWSQWTWRVIPCPQEQDSVHFFDRIIYYFI